MLFGQSDIDINFDNLLSNPDVNVQGNDANMDLDELIGTYDSLESSSKISGNDMDLDLDSIMADLDGNFAGSEIPNGMSGNNLNMDLSSILVNMNGSLVYSIYSNEIQNNGVQSNGIQSNGVNEHNEHNEHLDIYAEVANEDINGALVDFTLENVNGHNGYSHETINGVVDMVKQ